MIVSGLLIIFGTFLFIISGASQISKVLLLAGFIGIAYRLAFYLVLKSRESN